MKILALFIGLDSECGADMWHMNLLTKLCASSMAWWLRCVFHHGMHRCQHCGHMPIKVGRFGATLVISHFNYLEFKFLFDKSFHLVKPEYWTCNISLNFNLKWLVNIWSNSWSLYLLQVFCNESNAWVLFLLLFVSLSLDLIWLHYYYSGICDLLALAWYYCWHFTMTYLTNLPELSSYQH